MSLVMMLIQFGENYTFSEKYPIYQVFQTSGVLRAILRFNNVLEGLTGLTRSCCARGYSWLQ